MRNQVRKWGYPHRVHFGLREESVVIGREFDWGGAHGSVAGTTPDLYLDGYVFGYRGETDQPGAEDSVSR